MNPEQLDQHTGYQADFRFHDENLRTLAWYADRLVGALERTEARSLLSLGIGHAVVSQRIFERLDGVLDSYTIVEGSKARIEELRAAASTPDWVRIHHGLFEDFDPTTLVDAVEMGFVLEHVEDPLLVLRRYTSCLRSGGVLVIAVPNARSLHRLFGHQAGLLSDLYGLSEQDRQLGHRRYFDLDAVSRLAAEAGLTVTGQEGLYLKCLTTEQLESLGLPPAVQEAFFRVGADYPELANAIYLETTR